MTTFLTRRQVRELDRRAIEEYGLPGVVLMENAGRGVVELLVDLGISGRVIICCGKGNNGGDGYVIARHLDCHRVPVELIVCAARSQIVGDAAIHLQVAEHAGIPVHFPNQSELTCGWLSRRLQDACWIVDALFGTGLTGPLCFPYDAIVRAMNEANVPKLAVDIPSGLDCDTGLPLGETVRADHTATFVAAKNGFAVAEAGQWLGKVHVIPIGLPRRLLESADSV
jgi:NAD(P)H-hydrate epimerase